MDLWPRPNGLMIFRVTLLITRVTAAVNPAPWFKKVLPGAIVGPARAAAHTAVLVAWCGFMMAGGGDGIDGRGEGSEGDEFILLIRLVIDCVERRGRKRREEEEEDLMKVDRKPLVSWSSGTLILVPWLPALLVLVSLVPWFWSFGFGPPGSLILVLWSSGLDPLVLWFWSSSPLVLQLLLLSHRQLPLSPVLFIQGTSQKSL